MQTSKNIKPLGRRSYTSIPHLPGSNKSVGDYEIELGQAKILTEKARDRLDWIIVQEKLDGTNVSVAKVAGKIVPLIRAGYRAVDSEWPMHHEFHEWVMSREFHRVIDDGERICGEWLKTPHGTLYNLENRCPFAAFDLMKETTRATWDTVRRRHTVDKWPCALVPTIHSGPPIKVGAAMALMGSGFYGAVEQPEGIVYRCERNQRVEFIAKYVRPGFVPGRYL